MRKRFVIRNHEHFVSGPMHVVQRYERLLKANELSDGVVSMHGSVINKTYKSLGMTVRIRKIENEKEEKRAERSPDHVTVSMPTSAKIEPSMGSVFFKRKWCSRIPENPKWCAVLHRGMFKGMYQIIQISDEGITCSDRVMRPFKPTYMRTMVKNPNKWVKIRR